MLESTNFYVASERCSRFFFLGGIAYYILQSQHSQGATVDSAKRSV